MSKEEHEKCELAVVADHCPDAMFLCRELGSWEEGDDKGEILLTTSGVAVRYKDDQYHITFEELARAVAGRIDLKLKPEDPKCESGS